MSGPPLPPSIHPSIASSSIHLSAMLTHMLTTQSGSTDNRRVKTNELCLTIFPPPPTRFSSPLKCLLFRQGEMKRYWSPRGDKVSDLVRARKKNKTTNKAEAGLENLTRLVILWLELCGSRGSEHDGRPSSSSGWKDSQGVLLQVSSDPKGHVFTGSPPEPGSVGFHVPDGSLRSTCLLNRRNTKEIFPHRLHKNLCSPFIFIDTEIKLGVVVAEGSPQI